MDRQLLQWAAAGMIGLGTAGAYADPATTAAMQARVQSLEAKIAALENSQQQDQADLQQAIDGLIADADRHSQLMDDLSPASGYVPGTGFVLQSDNGDFLMHPGVLFQFGYMGSYRSGDNKTDTTSTFDIRRLQLSLAGNVYGPNLAYYFQVHDERDDGVISLQDAYAMYRISSQSPLALKAGQFKDPVFHEFNLYESNLLAVDRSRTDELLGGGQTRRVDGAAMIYDEERFRGQIVVHDGFSSLNDKFYPHGGEGAEIGSGAGVTPTNFGLSARAEYLLIGDRSPTFNPFSQYDQFTSLNARQETLVLGGGADWSEAGANNIFFHTFDAQYNCPNGWNAYAAYLGTYRDLNTDLGVPAGHYYDYGALIQGGYLITDRIEAFGRYDYTHLDGKAVPMVMKDTVHEFTIGANYYLHGQNVKLTVDGSWLPNGSAGGEADSSGQIEGRNEFILRAQAQLWF